MPIAPPRRLALDVLNRLDRTDALLDPIMEQVQAENPFSEGRDRSLFQHLVYGVLRWRGRIDWIVGHFSKTPLKKIDPSILNIIRIGLFQVLFLDRIPVSAAVNTAVEMAKQQAPPWVVRFVNGLLRNAAANHATVPFPDPEKEPDRYLAAHQSFPRWMIRRWISRFGAVETELLCSAVNRIPPITIRTNTAKTSRDDLAAALSDFTQNLRKAPQAPDGISFFRPSVPICELPWFREGGFQVQDEAAQLVGLLLSVEPGQKVLDACAGLGGKTGHIAQLMENKGTLVALDRDAGKLARLETEMRRLGIGIVRTKALDLESPPTKPRPPDRFDRILLDAPCSGLGVIRRNPDAKWKTGKKALARFARRQQRFLSRLAELVSPSGILVYSVCSMETEETDQVVDAFLKDHPEFVVYSRRQGPAIPSADFFDDRGFFRSYPHRHDMDGFFAAALTKDRAE